MSPLQIRILLHYYSNIDDYSGIEPDIFIKELAEIDMLERAYEGEERNWKLTLKAQAYIDYILRVPLPRQQWIIDI